MPDYGLCIYNPPNPTIISIRMEMRKIYLLFL